MQELLSRLAPKRLCDGCDSWEWKWGKKKAFSVKSMYSVLMGGQGGHIPPINPFPYKVVWKANVPLNLVWEALIGHLDRATAVMQSADPRGILSAWPCINTRGMGAANQRPVVEDLQRETKREGRMHLLRGGAYNDRTERKGAL
ncbi:hypothetical protein FRX31_017791 [Thalictrum thalictroides]|uniref:Uncharacterized protein n=1 Tax=Thalictrum thalictroides TaxID=46969 RepID=A0A7J6W5Y6_THATH|nr:hypothetical protein FRX31_017791 [Thalictrum thalictroides]